MILAPAQPVPPKIIRPSCSDDESRRHHHHLHHDIESNKSMFLSGGHDIRRHSNSSFSKDEVEKYPDDLRSAKKQNNNETGCMRAKKSVRFHQKVRMISIRSKHNDASYEGEDKKDDNTRMLHHHCWYTGEDYTRFRERESKLVKQMSKSFNGASFSVDGVESKLHKYEKRRRIINARHIVLLQQEAFWKQDDEVIEQQRGHGHAMALLMQQESFWEQDDEVTEQEQGHGHDMATTVQAKRSMIMALSYSEVSTESSKLALERADWNRKQVTGIE